MPRPDFTVRCTDPEAAGRPATWKVAAAWSGGGYAELKTYGFADDECLERVLAEARRRAARLVLADGETLGPVQAYPLAAGRGPAR